eukprot:gene42102-52192_t
MEPCLKQDADVMRERVQAPPLNIPFYKAVIKVQSGKENTLTEDEARAIRRFRRVEAEPEEEEEVEDVTPVEPGFTDAMYREERERMNKKSKVASGSEYISMDFIHGTSCVIERLFSHAGNILTADRSSMNPLHVENLLMCRANRHLWSVETIQNILTRLRNDRVRGAGGQVVAPAVGEDPPGRD